MDFQNHIDFWNLETEPKQDARGVCLIRAERSTDAGASKEERWRCNPLEESGSWREEDAAGKTTGGTFAGLGGDRADVVQCERWLSSWERSVSRASAPSNLVRKSSGSAC